MIGIVLVPLGDDSGATIVEYEAAVLPMPGDFLDVSVLRGTQRETTRWRVADQPRQWRVFDHELNRERMPVVFITCAPG